jgi:hypothetical protein
MLNNIPLSKMLTSQRKVCKLFIKFVIWNKFAKAEHLLEKYPDCIMPWQKAFEEASSNKSYNACKWIYNKAKLYSIPIDIHYRNNEILLIPCKMDYLDTINMIILLDINYPWLETIKPLLEFSKHKDKIIEIIQKNNS